MINLKIINEEYAKKAVGDFPFVSKHRITVLKKGLHRVINSKFKGISIRYNKKLGKYESLLVGYYNIPLDCFIVPPEMELTEGKLKMINSLEKKGLTKLSKSPTLGIIKFNEDSLEHKLAILDYKQFKDKSKNDPFNYEQRKRI